MLSQDREVFIYTFRTNGTGDVKGNKANGKPLFLTFKWQTLGHAASVTEDF
jgi:hypothetical protein